MAFQELIAKYKELIRKDGNTGELYKWQCVEHFQDNFNIDAPDFAEMLKTSLKKRKNLLYFNSSGFILAAAKYFPEKTREMFRKLYNEKEDLHSRLISFQQQASILLPALISKINRKKVMHEQDERTLSFYLAMMYPKKYPLYMSKIYDFMLLHLPDEVERPTGERFLHFIQVGHEFSDLIEKDEELQDLVVNTLNEECFNGNQSLMIFQDILWRCHQDAKKVNLTRICWNTNGWTKPSGSSGKSTDKKSHEGKHGFGNEEWLFDDKKTIAGYRYGYLQPLIKGRKKHLSETLDILLYTIDGESKKRYCVAKISNLQVLSDEEADEVYEKYRKNNWIAEMEQQIKDSGAKGADNFRQWEGINVLNVKFRTCDVIKRNPFIELPASSCNDMDRYLLYIKDENAIFPGGQEGNFAPNASVDKNTDESTAYLLETAPPKGRNELPTHNPSFAGVDINYEKKQRDATDIGMAGEDLVIKYEKDKLKKILGLEHLVDKVEKRKDGEGYDILSFDKEGNEILIEAKTTAGGIETPFDISLNEVLRAKKDHGRYKIYRLYSFDAKNNTARYYVVDDIDSLLFEPVNYKAYWKEKESTK